MRRLVVFNSVSLDGYFVDAHGDMRWAHHSTDPEWNDYVAGNAGGGGTLVFGRVTYQMMASYWSSALAMANDPVVAERMNALPKVVFSRTLREATWSNTTLVNGDMVAAVKQMKAKPGDGMVIFGSGTVIAQLAQADLIDEFQLVVVPFALGGGRTMFDGVTRPLKFNRTSSRSFANGNVVLSYQPIQASRDT